ncbi:hypothetical protein [Bacteriovorax sp. DB6_IX]|uniref:hypothetical protein n=1 Tax=Bacteriovorax sp. DB6_IX TaxID=1353530 RepID=UPI00038A559D|nr:hypothetical protein [Bacteriovorax sp. DB6_IX]EQC50897.1 hypothetical protein M901_2939 [Bacteriovorax sp. DB6_IX]
MKIIFALIFSIDIFASDYSYYSFGHGKTEVMGKFDSEIGRRRFLSTGNNLYFSYGKHWKEFKIGYLSNEIQLDFSDMRETAKYGKMYSLSYVARTGFQTAPAFKAFGGATLTYMDRINSSKISLGPTIGGEITLNHLII